MKLKRRNAIPVATQRKVLVDVAYKCLNPRCSHFYPANTLNFHHINQEGGNGPANLAILCSQCHADTHKGKYSAQTIRDWKTRNSQLQRDKVAIEAQTALRFGIPGYLRSKDQSSKITHLCLSLLGSAHKNTPPIVLHLLRFELAKALHRVGASTDAASIMRNGLGAKEGDDELIEQGFGETKLFELRHALARENLQLGNLNLASSQLASLVSAARDMEYYGTGSQPKQFHLETSAQVVVDMLHARVLRDPAGAEAAFQQADQAISKLSFRSKKAISIRSQYDLYRGVSLSHLRSLKAARPLILDSLHSRTDQSRRGQAIRLNMLAITYLRDYLEGGKTQSRRHSLDEAIRSFRLTLDKIRFPDESHTHVLALLGSSLALKLYGEEMQSSQHLRRATAIANFVDLPLVHVKQRLLSILGKGFEL